MSINKFKCDKFYLILLLCLKKYAIVLFIIRIMCITYDKHRLDINYTFFKHLIQRNTLCDSDIIVYWTTL